MSFPAFTLYTVVCAKNIRLYNNKKITRWLENMNFIFLCFYYLKIKFISSCHRVISSMYICSFHLNVTLCKISWKNLLESFRLKYMYCKNRFCFKGSSF